MTEKEKMIAGKLYNPHDSILVEDRMNAKIWCGEFNLTHPEDLEERLELISNFFEKSDENTYIEPPFFADYGYNISVGKSFYSNHDLVILDCAKVTIGDNVMIAPDVGIYTASHPIVASERNSGVEFALPITIGNNVWIGGQTVINPGVTIGDNTVIGSGSVVTKNIPANVIAVGNPCKVLRKITDEDKMLNH